MSIPRAFRLSLLLVAVGGIAWGAYTLLRHRKDPPTSLLLYGNVDIRQVLLAFHDNGRIRAVFVEEGEKVEAGKLVAELDPARYEQARAQAAGLAAAQRGVLARLLAGSRPEEIAAAQARVKAAEAVLKDADETFRRAEALALTQYVPQQRRDNAEAALKSARAQLESERQALTLAVKGPRQEDIDAARAQLEASEAALALAERQCEDTRLYAPQSGVIQERILEPGDMASPATPVLTLALTDPLWVRAYVPESDLGRIAPGMRAEVRSDSFPGKAYRGWVGFISPTAEFTPKPVETTELRSKLVYRVRVYVCNPENELRLGMPVTVSIPLGQTATPAAATPDGGAANPCQGG